MRLTQKILLTTLVCLLALVPLALAQDGTVTVTPESGPIGTLYTITVNDVAPNADFTVAFIYDETNEVVYSTAGTSDTSGHFELFVTSEERDRPGLYRVEVSDRSSIVAEGTFSISEGTLITSNIFVAPRAVEIGRPQNISVDGLGPNETVTIEVTENATGAVVYSRLWSATASGNLQIEIISEETDVSGDYTVTVYNAERRILAQTEITLLDVPGQNPIFTVTAEETSDNTIFNVVIEGARPAAGIKIRITDIRTYEVVHTAEVLADIEDGSATYSYRVEEVGVIANYRFDFEIGVIRPPTGRGVFANSTPTETTAKVNPSAGPIGTSHSIQISGLRPGEEITVQLLLDGEMVYTTRRTADNAGNAQATIFSEEGDTIGTYTVHIVRNGAVIAETLFTIEGDTTQAQPTPESSDVVLTINPNSGGIGTRHNVRVSGLDAGETITLNVRFNGQIVFSTPKTADANGNVAMTVFSEEGDPSGTYTVEVMRGNTAVAQGDFTVTGGTTTQPTPEPGQTRVSMTIVPDSGPIGTDHIITISGLGAGETITVNVALGDTVMYSTQKTADRNGAVMMTVYSEAGDTPGTYSVIALQDGQTLAQSDFTILGETSVTQPTPEPGTGGTLQPVAADVTITVIPEEGVVGAATTIDIKGLAPNDTYIVEIALSGQIFYKSERTTDANGMITIALVNQTGPIPGTYSVNVYKQFGFTEFTIEGETATPDVTVTPSPEITPTPQVTPTPATSAPQMQIVPNSGPRGTAHDIIIGGLDANETVTVEIDFAGDVIYSTESTADANGSIAIEIETEDTDAAGDYTITLLRDGQVAATAILTIEEEAVAPQSVTITISPESAPAGTEHTISITGLDPNETIELELEFEDVMVSEERTADQNGVIEFSLETVEDDTPGVYTFRIIRNGEIAAEATLTVEGPSSELPSSIVIIPDRAPQGSRHTIEISGLDPGENIVVEVIFDRDIVYSTNKTADSSGNVSFPIETEASDRIGEYQVQVVRNGVVDSEGFFSVEEAVTVTPARLVVNPSSAPHGSDHTLEITGLNASEVVVVEIVFNGDVIYTSQRIADADGNVRYTIQTEDSDEPGDYTVRIVRDGQIDAEAILTVEAEAQPLSLSVNPSSAPRVSDHTIEINGLRANEVVVIEITFEGDVVYTSHRTADTNGDIRYVIETEASDGLGDYSVRVLRNGEVSAEAPLTITDETMESLSLTVSPEAGPRGTNHIIEITGLNTSERIQIEISLDGTLNYSTLRSADENGVVSFLVVSEADDLAGEYLISVYRNGQTAASATLIIEDSSILPSRVEVSITPSSGPIGTTHTITVKGLNPDAVITVDVLYDGVSVLLYEELTDSTGALNTAVISVEGDLPGDYTVNILQDGIIVGSAIYTTSDLTSNTPLIIISPESAPIGTLHTINISNLSATQNYEVRIMFDGAEIYTTQRTSDTKGNLSVDVVSESSDLPGVYSVEVIRNSAILSSATFTIEAVSLPIPTITITPSSGPRGTTHVIDVNGTNPGDILDVEIQFDGRVVYTRQITADASGNASFPILSEITDPTGIYKLVISRSALVIGQAEFSITDESATSPRLSITPATGPRGTTHIIDIARLNANETITVQIVFEGQIVYTHIQTADANGAVSFPILTEATDPSGAYTIQLIREGVIAVEVTFTITDNNDSGSEAPSSTRGQSVSSNLTDTIFWMPDTFGGLASTTTDIFTSSSDFVLYC